MQAATGDSAGGTRAPVRASWWFIPLVVAAGASALLAVALGVSGSATTAASLPSPIRVGSPTGSTRPVTSPDRGGVVESRHVVVALAPAPTTAPPPAPSSPPATSSPPETATPAPAATTQPAQYPAPATSPDAATVTIPPSSPPVIVPVTGGTTSSGDGTESDPGDGSPTTPSSTTTTQPANSDS